MSYVKRSCRDEERILHDIPLHWTRYIVAVILTAMALFGVVFTFGLSLIALPFLWLPLTTIERAVTDRRIVAKHGVLNIHTDEMMLDAVETVELEQPLLGRILNYGDIIVTGRGDSDLLLAQCPHPLRVKQTIEAAREENEQRLHAPKIAA